MFTDVRLLMAALAVLALNAPLLAHHSVPVNYDSSRRITIEGTLTEIRWINPHSRFRLEVTKDDGSTEEWLAEMGRAQHHGARRLQDGAVLDRRHAHDHRITRSSRHEWNTPAVGHP